MQATFQESSAKIPASAVNLISHPDPIKMPVWQHGDNVHFVAADFRVDGLGNVLVVAVRHRPCGYEEIERTVIHTEDVDPADYAADLMSDLRGQLHDENIYGWETGDLAASIRAVLSPAIAAA